MNIKIKEVVKYNGHKVKASGVVDVSFKAMYSELTNSMQLLQLLNNDVKIKAKLPGDKPIQVGVFRVSRVIFNDDGESTLSFTSTSDFIEMENLNALVGTDEFQILLESEVEVEDEAEED